MAESEQGKLSGHVLLVEDNDMNRTLISRMLTKLGLRVSTAINGKKAVDLVAENSYDLILMDVNMPVMDGLQAAFAMKQSGVTTKIIALTANIAPEEKDQCLQAGYDDFLAKPIEREVFSEKMSEYLSGQSAREAVNQSLGRG